MKFSWVVLLAIVASVQLSSANTDCPKKPYTEIPFVAPDYDESTSTLYCNDCEADMREACTAKYIPEFFTYLSCKLNPDNPKSASECAAEQGPAIGEEIETCLSTGEGKYIILENSKLRSEKQVSICWLPHVLYNGVTNGCFTFNSTQELLVIICAIYNLLKMPVSVCESLPQGVQKIVEGIQGLKEEVKEEMKEEMKETISEAVTAVAVGIAIVDAGIEIVGQGVQKVKEEVKEMKEGAQNIQDAAKEKVKEEVDEKVADVAKGIDTANAIVQILKAADDEDD